MKGKAKKGKRAIDEKGGARTSIAGRVKTRNSSGGSARRVASFDEDAYAMESASSVDEEDDDF